MSTLLGILVGFGAVIFSIIRVSQQEITAVSSLSEIYLNLPSFMMVVGGTFAATLIAHPFSQLKRGIIGFYQVFFRKGSSFDQTIKDSCKFASAFSANGVSGLEDALSNYKKNNLLKDGIRMAVNGYKLEDITDYMKVKLRRSYDVEMVDYYVFKTMARTSPAIGMVGTLVGLIFMLNVMGEDPTKIGPFLL